MADISTELAAIESASRGEEVRDSIISALNKINDGSLGDMTKAVYDTDNDGTVDAAESVPFAGITGKPTTISGYGISDAYTKTEIDGMVSSVYHPAGSVAFANLPPLLSANIGKVYNVTDAFTTTSDFTEGAGKSYPAGTNVAIVEVTGGDIMYDAMAGFVDLSGYVQKETGKGLSTNDYTDAEKTKLAGIESGAEANVNADWNANSGDAQILNKPDLTVYQLKENGKGLSTNDYTTAEKEKLAGIEAGAEANVNADWDATSGDAQILHNPFSVVDGMLMITYEA